MFKSLRDSKMRDIVLVVLGLAVLFASSSALLPFKTCTQNQLYLSEQVTRYLNNPTQLQNLSRAYNLSIPIDQLRRVTYKTLTLAIFSQYAKGFQWFMEGCSSQLDVHVHQLFSSVNVTIPDNITTTRFPTVATCCGFNWDNSSHVLSWQNSSINSTRISVNYAPVVNLIQQAFVQNANLTQDVNTFIKNCTDGTRLVYEATVYLIKPYF